MKSKITFLVHFALVVLSTGVFAQTHVYNETTSSGMFIDGDGAQVANPVSDAVNSSANCAKSGTGGWKKIEYFPTYTPVAGNKLYFSVHNPNGAGPGQVKFTYLGNPVEQWGDNVTYTAGSTTGWVEYSVDLASHVGNQINKILIYPSGGSATATYIDNIYFASSSIFTIQSLTVYNETTSSGMFIDGDGAQVANPVSDAVNSSANCAKSGTGGWKKIEYFPTYTPVTGNKLYFSIHNPNGAGPGQVKFTYTGNPAEQWGDNVTYVAGSTTGWMEYSVDLASHVGSEINKILIYPSGGSSTATYIDNIYFASSSSLVVPSTMVYNETTSSGMFIDGNGAQVANPVSDAVNSSANCAKSGTGGWKKIEYFPIYTPVTGNKLYFSIHNPNGAGPGQVKFFYTGNPAEQWGDNITYVSGSTTGWMEYSVDLASHVGNEINKILIYPSGGSSTATYIDNIYFATNSTLSTNGVEKVKNQLFVLQNGTLQFIEQQNNTQIAVYDLTGRLLFEESITGQYSTKVIPSKGIYIIILKNEFGVSSQKVMF